MEVIQVQLVNPLQPEVLTDQMTLPGAWTSKSDHTASHREAIELALRVWSRGEVRLSSLQRDADVTQGERAGTGATVAWRYCYWCGLVDSQGNELACYAILYARYREHQEEEGER